MVDSILSVRDVAAVCRLDWLGAEFLPSTADLGGMRQCKSLDPIPRPH